MSENPNAKADEIVIPTQEHYALATKDAALGVGHVWWRVKCPAYASLNPDQCNCQVKDA